jgi:hypothetical protein
VLIFRKTTSCSSSRSRQVCGRQTSKTKHLEATVLHHYGLACLLRSSRIWRILRKRLKGQEIPTVSKITCFNPAVAISHRVMPRNICCSSLQVPHHHAITPDYEWTTLSDMHVPILSLTFRSLRLYQYMLADGDQVRAGVCIFSPNQHRGTA